MKNILVEKWEKTHLLDQLDDFNKCKCAISLQKAVDLLTGNKNDYMKEVDEKIGQEGFFAGCILPIVRRIYDTEEGAAKAPNIGMEWLFEDFGEYSILNYRLYKNLSDGIACDSEAEFVLSYMEQLKQKI